MLILVSPLQLTILLVDVNLMYTCVNFCYRVQPLLRDFKLSRAILVIILGLVVEKVLLILEHMTV